MMTPATLNPFWRHLASASLGLLILLCLAWEIFLAPLRPGGSLLFLKALPLAFAFRGILKGRLYTYQWASMLVLLYFMEGIMRGMGDAGLSGYLGWLEVLLSTLFFLAAVCYVRPAKKVAKARKHSEPS